MGHTRLGEFCSYVKLWYEKGAWASKSARRKIGEKTPAQVRSVAVVRHAALGDLVLTRCFLRELRRFFPNASITLSLISNYTYGAPEDLVDRVHVLHGRDQRGAPLHAQIAKARELGYHDIIFDLAATTRSYWLCLLNPAWIKIGFPYRALPRRLVYDAAILRSDLKFEAEIMLDMLSLLGCHTEYPPQFDLPGEPLQRTRPYIVYFTSATVADKRWPATRFAELIGVMAIRYPDYEHLVLEGVGTHESIEEIVAPLEGKQNVRGLKARDLESTIALLKGGTLVVSNDTGVRNLAIAAGTSTLGIFFSTVPYRYWPRYGIHDVVFNSDGSIPEVDAVLASAQQLMKRLSEVAPPSGESAKSAASEV